jgi:hypothetical protein
VPRHTPGPWRNDPEIGVTFGPDGTAIQTGGAGCAEEFRANAVLIAAAPDMLEALKATVKYLRYLRESYGVGNQVNDMIHEADRAIAKAETA